MVVIEFSNPLSSGVERIFFKGCFGRSFPSFWIIGGVDSRKEEKKPWAKVKKVDKNCSDDDKFIRKIKEHDNQISQEGIEDPSDNCQGDPYQKWVEKAHPFLRKNELIIYKNVNLFNKQNSPLGRQFNGPSFLSSF